MAINAGIQLRNSVVGAIRCGDQVLSSNGNMIAHKLDKFRLTSHSRVELQQAADLYGGTVQPWNTNGWGKQFEIYTEADELPIGLPPGELVIRQDMELYTGAGLQRRCDGINMSRPRRGPCQCPQPDDPDDPYSVDEAIQERKRLAALKTPSGCKPLTRFSLILSDVGDVGVWVLRTRSEEAAAEVRGKVLILERARAADIILSARVAIEQRQLMVSGQLRQYPVPVIRLDDTLRALAEGTAGRSLAEQLPARPTIHLALPAAGPHEPIGRALPAGAVPDIAVTAQSLADQAEAAASRLEVNEIALTARRAGLADDMVWVREQVTEPGSALEEVTLATAVNRYWHALPPLARPEPATVTGGDPWGGDSWPDDDPASA